MNDKNFPNLNKYYNNLGNESEKLERKKVESLALFAMFSIYSKSITGKKLREKELLENISDFIKEDLKIFMKKSKRWQNVEISEEVLPLLNRSIERIKNCKHIMYKTFCHRCPTPCFLGEDREEILPIMDYSKFRIMLYHPYMGYKFIERIFKSKKLIKKLDY